MNRPQAPDPREVREPREPREPREVHVIVPRSARYYALGGDGKVAPRALWLVLHGYGQLARYFLRPFRGIACPSRLVVAPEGLSRFYLEAPGRSHGEARVGATWMTREDRAREIVDQHAWLDRAIEDASAGHPGAMPRLVVVGFSQGVATACRWALATRHRIDHVVAWAGTMPPDLDPDAARRALDGRLSIVAGRADTIVPPARIEEGVAALATMGVRAGMHWHEGDHRVDEPLLARLADGIDAGGAEAPTAA